MTMDVETETILRANRVRLHQLAPLERAAGAYHAAVRAHKTAQMLQDDAFKAQAQNQTYGTVQVWQDAVAAQHVAGAAVDRALSQLTFAALLVPEVF